MTSGWLSSLLDLAEVTVVGREISPRASRRETESGLKGEIPPDPVVVVGVPESASNAGSGGVLFSIPNRWSAKCELNTVETGLKLNATKSVFPGGALCGLLPLLSVGRAKLGLGGWRGFEPNEFDAWWVWASGRLIPGLLVLIHNGGIMRFGLGPEWESTVLSGDVGESVR